MSESAVGMDCGVVEWVKRSTLRRVYENPIEGRGGKGSEGETTSKVD